MKKLALYILQEIKSLALSILQLLIYLVLMIGVFGGLLYYIKSGEDEKEASAQAELAPYNAQMERYLKKNAETRGKLPAWGRILFVEGASKKVDKFDSYNFVNYRRPSSPDEVDSVVLHNCEYIHVGTYSNNARAMQQLCRFTVIDIETGAWSNWGVFEGSLPPEEIKRKPGSTSDELGGLAIHAFVAAGGIDAPPPAKHTPKK